MSIVQEVLDALAAVSEGIDNIQTISSAIKTGRDYLVTKHPDLAEDLSGMCVEMRKTSLALATASSIVTHFRFVIDKSTEASEGVRFNEHLMRHKEKAEVVDQQIEQMRGHCSIIKQHAEQLVNEDDSGFRMRGFARLLGLHSDEKERALGMALEGIYNEEMQYHLGVYNMARAIQAAISSVQSTLGSQGMILPANVPKAAMLLGEYAQLFGDVEERCKRIATELQQSIDALQNVHA